MMCSQGAPACRLLPDRMLPAAKSIPASCCHGNIPHSPGQRIYLQALKIHENTGLAVLVPDLYHGKIGVDAEEATHVRIASAVACYVFCCVVGQPTVMSCSSLLEGTLAAAMEMFCDFLLSCCIMLASCGRCQQLDP